MQNIVYLAAKYIGVSYYIAIGVTDSLEYTLSKDKDLEVYAVLYAADNVKKENIEEYHMNEWLKEVFLVGEKVTTKNVRTSIEHMKYVAKLTGCRFQKYNLELATITGRKMKL